MTSTQQLPQILDCCVSSCSYDAESSCHAAAITVGGEHARCGTFVEISFHPGLERTGVVGGCHRTDCSHNTKLECTAAAVQVGAAADKADCLTYSPR